MIFRPNFKYLFIKRNTVLVWINKHKSYRNESHLLCSLSPPTGQSRNTWASRRSPSPWSSTRWMRMTWATTRVTWRTSTDGDRPTSSLSGKVRQSFRHHDNKTWMLSPRTFFYNTTCLHSHHERDVRHTWNDSKEESGNLFLLLSTNQKEDSEETGSCRS